MPTHQTTTNNEREQEKNAHYTQTQCQHTKLPPNTEHGQVTKCVLHTNTMRTHQTTTNTKREQEKNACYAQTQCKHTKVPPITNANRGNARYTHTRCQHIKLSQTLNVNYLAMIHPHFCRLQLSDGTQEGHLAKE